MWASATEAGGWASIAEREKSRKYAHLDKSYLFQPIAVETNGSVGLESLQFLKQLGQRIWAVKGEPSSYAYLLHRLSMAIQIGNAVSVLDTLDKAGIEPLIIYLCMHTLFIIIMHLAFIISLLFHYLLCSK